MESQNYRFKLGEFKCVALQDGTQDQPVEVINEELPEEELVKVLGDHGLPTDGVTFGYNCLFIDTGEHKILIDTGYGWYSEKGAKLLTNLKEAGIAAADIEKIIFTHADGDHVGGTLDPEGRVIYPNADYILPRVSWDYWTSEANLSQITEEAHNFGRDILPRIKHKVEVVDQDIPFLGGFRVLPYPAHRPDHVVILITSGQDELLHLADAVIHPLHLEYPEWICPYDSQPELAYQDRERLLDAASDHNSMVFVSHFPFPGLGAIKKEGKGWRWHPVDGG